MKRINPYYTDKINVFIVRKIIFLPYFILKSYALIIISIFIIYKLPFIILEEITDSTVIDFYSNYLGGIIGGFLTLIGVLLAFNFIQKQLIEERRLKLSPYLKPTIIQSSNKTVSEEDIILRKTTEDENSLVKFYIQLENIGAGSALDICVWKFGRKEPLNKQRYFIENQHDKTFYCEVDIDFIKNYKIISLWFLYLDLYQNLYEQEIVLNIEPNTYSITLRNYKAPYKVKYNKIYNILCIH